MRTEDQIRTAIRHEVEDALPELPDRMPRQVHSRVRRRQAASVGLAGVLLAILSLGAIGLGRMVIDEPQTRLADQPMFDRPEKQAVLASGVFRRAAWQLEVTYDDDPEGWCLVMSRGPGTSRFCSFTGKEPLELRRGLGFVFGTIDQNVAFVETKNIDVHRRVETRIFEIPSALEAPFDVVLALPKRVGDIEMRIFDHRGEKIALEFISN
jgi:hypothetical protein